MLLEGVNLMVVRMTTVFSFLTLLVIVLQISAKVFDSIGHRWPDPTIATPRPAQAPKTLGDVGIAVALGENRAVILANHGLLTVGSSPADAVGWFVLMERVAEVQMKARDALPISAEAARAARDDIIGDGYGWDLFNWATRRHLTPR